MVKSVLSSSRQGLRDWVLQRASAVIMAIFSVFLIGYLLFHPGLSFAEWHNLFATISMKIATILFVASVLYHAWIGLWTIFTDYIKCSLIRVILNFVVLLMLAVCLVWGLLILWSV